MEIFLYQNIFAASQKFRKKKKFRYAMFRCPHKRNKDKTESCLSYSRNT